MVVNKYIHIHITHLVFPTTATANESNVFGYTYTERANWNGFQSGAYDGTNNFAYLPCHVVHLVHALVPSHRAMVLPVYAVLSAYGWYSNIRRYVYSR